MIQIGEKYKKGALTRIKYENVVYNSLLAIALSAAEYDEVLAKLC